MPRERLTSYIRDDAEIARVMRERVRFEGGFQGARRRRRGSSILSPAYRNAASYSPS